MANKYVDATLRFVDKFTSPAQQAIAKMNRMSNTYAKMGKSISKVGDSISGVGSKLTGGVTAPVAALGASAVKSFGDVDKSLKLVQSTMGSTPGQAKALESSLKTAAANSVFGMQDAADATLNFARQGFNAKQASDMITPALNLAAGSATELSTVTGGLGNALKMFGKDSDYASTAADIFSKAQAQANTTTTDLFEAMSVAGPICNSVSWSMSDLATITDIFGDAGISGSEGATALKTGLARLASPAKEGSVWMKKLGLDIFNADGSMKSMTDVQNQLHNSFSKLTSEQQLTAASAIFGKNQMAKWMTLINASPAQVQKYSDALGDCDGTAQNMADSLLSGMGGSLEKLNSSFDVMKYNVGQIASEYLKPFVDQATSVIDKFNNMDSTMQLNIVKWAAMAAAVGPTLILVGKGVKIFGSFFTVASKISKFGATLRGLGTAFTAVRTAGTGILGIITGISAPVLIAVAAIAALAGGAYLIWKNFDTVKAKLGQFKEYISKVFKQALPQMQPFVDIINRIKAKMSELSPKLQEIWDAMQPVLNAIGTAFTAVFQFGLGAAIGTAINTLGVFANSALTMVEGVIAALDGFIDFFGGIFTGDINRVVKGIGKIFEGAVTIITTPVKATANAIIGVVNSVISGLNGISVTIPDWSPIHPGEHFGVNLPSIPYLAKGTNNWTGGKAIINEKGGEIVDLPSGSRVYPHDQSLDMARKSGSRVNNITINRLADTIVVREEADIDKIATRLAKKLKEVAENSGSDLSDVEFA